MRVSRNQNSGMKPPSKTCKKVARTRLLISFFSIIWFCVVLTSECLAWGPTGHRWISNRAIDNLEGHFAELFSKHRDRVVAQTMGPDYRKDRDPEESSRHFVDLERYGEFPFSLLELDYDQLVSQLGEDTVQRNGTGLWAAHGTFNRLVEAFQRRDLEQILLYCSDLSHYVADLHQPFHTTENYDGQLTGQVGIHSRFESDLVNLYLDQVPFSEAAPTHLGQVLPRLYEIVLESYQWVDKILLADRRIVSDLGIEQEQYPDQYFRRLFDQVGAVVETRLNQAAHQVGSLWWMAWERAGQPEF